jgi:glycogen debranching enzyme
VAGLDLAHETVKRKLAEAEDTVKLCARGKGFYAASPLNYAYQYWLRDVVFCLSALMSLGYQERLRNHLTIFLEVYRRKGRVPALVNRLGGLIYLVNFARMLRKPSLLTAYPLKFMLPNFFRFGLQPWTGDSQPLLLIGLHQYTRLTGDIGLMEDYREEAEKLAEDLASRVKTEGFVQGSGWMDAMANYVEKPTLACQLLACRALELSGRLRQASELKTLIREAYWSREKGCYTDLPEPKGRMDGLGNSLAILYDLASAKEAALIVEALKKASTPYGILNIYPPYPKHVCSQRPHTYQNSAIWPMVQGHVVVALAKMGLKEEAEKEFMKMVSLPELNEWYTPEGKPKGSPNQLWTAAMLVSAWHAIAGTTLF